MFRFADFLFRLLPITVLACALMLVALVAVHSPQIEAQMRGEPLPVEYRTAPVEKKPIVGDRTDHVLGLADVLVDEHERRTEAEGAFRAIKAEASQIIAQLVNEINRLKSRPTLQPGTETAGEPTPAGPS